MKTLFLFALWVFGGHSEIAKANSARAFMEIGTSEIGVRFLICETNGTDIQISNSLGVLLRKTLDLKIMNFEYLVRKSVATKVEIQREGFKNVFSRIRVAVQQTPQTHKEILLEESGFYSRRLNPSAIELVTLIDQLCSPYLAKYQKSIH